MKKVLLTNVITFGVISLILSACGTGQIKYGAGGANIPNGEGPGVEEPVPGGPATTAGVLSIDSVYPAAGSRGAAMGTDISITFDKALDPSTIPGNVFIGLGGGAPSISAPTGKSASVPMFSESAVQGNFALDELGTTLVFNPDGKLIDCENYQVTVTTDLKTVDGESLPENQTWQFLSTCPGLLAIDLAGMDDRGYGLDVTSEGKLYVSGFVQAGMYSYAPWIDRRNMLSGPQAPSDWQGLSGGYDGYILPGMTDPGAPWSSDPTFQPDGVAAVYDAASGKVFTAGWENPDWEMIGWLQALDSSGAGLLDDGAMDNQGISFIDPDNPSRQIACAGLARNSATGDLALTCLYYLGMETTSYLYIVAADGTLKGYGSFGALWGDNSMFRKAAFDSAGNLYITLSPHYYLTNIDESDFLRVIRFSADQLDDLPMGPPAVVATYPEGVSAGADIAVANEGGSLFYYVAGYISQLRSLDADALLVKFDSQGNVVWENRHAGAAGLTDMFNAVTYNGGHVYVTGYEGRETTGTVWYEPERRNMIWKKISSAGNVVAEGSFVLGVHGADDSSEGHAILVDENANGEIYIVGSAYNGAARLIDVAVWVFGNDFDGVPYCQDPAYMGSANCSAETRCSDRLDNDSDGDVDCADANCAGDDVCELEGEHTCDDYVDNDADGDVDCSDSGCGFFYRCGGMENYGDVDSKCGDGIDNDQDGDIDCADVDCLWPDDIPPCEDEESLCEDGIDNDGDGLIDCDDPSCEAACPFEVTCYDKVDNDNDGDTDCADSDCADDSSCEFPNELTCYDMLDNDADGLQDCADVDDCPPVPGGGVNPSDCEEVETLCYDSFDNDGNGLWDCDKPIGQPDAGDPNCKRLSVCGGKETDCITGDCCADGIDNDLDGGSDCEDPQGDCSDTEACREKNCTDGLDNDLDSDIDCYDAEDCCTELVCIQSGVCPELCDDGVDNDDDGLIDCEDPNCFGPSCPEVCDDGVDNDGDGIADCSDDDCVDGPYCNEYNCGAGDSGPIGSTCCSDGSDNDSNGNTDCADWNCNRVSFSAQYCEYGSESTCDDSFDNDGDGNADCDDSDCSGEPGCVESDCNDQIDNDGDSLIDCDDSDCDSDPNCFVPSDEVCSGGDDEDGDGYIDCYDPDCIGDPACPTCGGQGCTPADVGDGQCEWYCYYYSCNWDGGDCDDVYNYCAQGCPDDSLGDGSCDEFCNNAACNYDDGDCSAESFNCDDSTDNDGDTLTDCDDGHCIYEDACYVDQCGWYEPCRAAEDFCKNIGPDWCECGSSGGCSDHDLDADYWCQQIMWDPTATCVGGCCQYGS